jgi:hypothetical protein
MLNSLKHILAPHNINYYITFELYEDNLDMHCHGFLTFSKLTDIALIKRDLRQIYRMPKLKQGEKNVLVHIKPIGLDTDQQKRWIGYCYKDLNYMIKQTYTPMYRILEGMKISNTVQKTRTTPRIVLVPDDEEIELYKQELKNKEDAKLKAEYLLYEKLKAKFENKIKNI